MFVLLVLAALAVLVLGLGLTWLRMHRRQESKAVVEQVLDLTVYNQLRATEAALPYYVDSGNNLHWRDES